MDLFVLPECGGPAATSALAFLLNIDMEQYEIIGYDKNQLIENAFNKSVSESSLDKDELYLPIPTDEYSRTNSDFIQKCYDKYPIYSNNEMAKYHNKLYAQTKFNDCEFSDLKYPNVSDDTIVYRLRPIIGAGTKDHIVTRNPKLSSNYLVTAEINDVKAEYVIDFYITKSGNIGFLAREVLLMKNGADQIVKLVTSPTLNLRFQKILSEIKTNFNWFGIGNLQVIIDSSDNIWFIEIAARLSGSSYVGLEVDYNPLHYMILDYSYTLPVKWTGYNLEYYLPTLNLTRNL